MNVQKHIAIAAIVAKQQGRDVRHVYDYNQSKYVLVHFNSTSGPNHVNLFDYDRSSYVTGTLPTIFDYGSGTYINLNINGNRFNGFDYETGSHFNGMINGNMVNIFDFQHGRYFNYGV